MDLKNKGNIYIVCPAKIATGGTELLHQLLYKLEKNNKKVFMYYVGDIAGDPVAERFKKYNPKYITDIKKIEDKKENLIIVPETITEELNLFKNIGKCIWWLSVDNHLRTRHRKNLKYHIKKIFNKLERPEVDYSDKNIYHLYQSEYAKDYLEKNGVKNLEYLSDYLNDTFLKEEVEYTEKNRENIVLYNPLKGVEFTKKIMDRAKGIKFIALEKMSPEEIKDICKKSKIYIDFGEHPGKDRFPREASLLGCLIITGKKGSALNNMDVPLLSKYKFEDEDKNIDIIIQTIEKLFVDYDKNIKDFESYILRTKNEEKEFEKDVLKIFG